MNASFVFLSSGLGEFETALLIESCHRFEKKKKQLAGLTRSLKVMEYENLKNLHSRPGNVIEIRKKIVWVMEFQIFPKIVLSWWLKSEDI